ncbi:uncharacterized protein LOC126817152 isoform X2 [Patella vulgata]|nr:uncharacterized protein LOC126817152 isoform X2 [Patella vulgata]
MGCMTELIWSLEADNLNVIIRKNNNITIEDDSKYNIGERYTKNGPVTVLTILNTTLDDTGLYSRHLALTPKLHQNDIHLSVLDFKWRNDIKPVKVKVEDDVMLKWAYDKIDLSYEIFVYRKLPDSTKRYLLVDANLVGNGIWNNAQMDPRIHFHKTSNGSTEFVELTLQNITENDMSYVYIIELDFGNSCFMREETVILIEEPRWSFEKEIEGQMKENVSLNWKYYYSYPSKYIKFNRRDDHMDYHILGYWNGNRFFRGVDVDKFIFKRNVVLGGEEITLTIPNTVADDFNTTYGCNVTFSNGLTSYKELILKEGPRVDVPNIYIKGAIGDTVKLIFEYYYRFPATRINVMRNTSSEINFKNVGYWTESGYNSVLDDDRLIFQKQAISDGGKIYLGILDTTSTDYNTTYIFSVLFENRQHVSIEIHLILQTESGSLFELNLVLVTVLPILAVLTCVLVGLGIYGYKRKAKRVVDTSSHPTNNMRHSYISLNSVVIFHANRDSTATNTDSTATNTESTASNDTDAYANPYDPINRDGIDTSKNFYIPLQNPETSNIDQGDDVQETNIDSNSVTNIDDIQTGDDDGDVDDDDDTSTHESNPYDALNKYTMNSDVNSYISLPPCMRSVDDMIIVKKRPSTI